MLLDDNRIMDIVALNEYAAEHYEEVVHGFLAVKGLNRDEYEDIVTPKYLYAVRRYWTHPELRRICSFKTHAYLQMYSAVKDYWTFINRPKRKAPVYSLELFENTHGYRGNASLTDFSQRLQERAEAIDLWERIKPLLRQKELRALYLKAMGYSYQEIADAVGTTRQGIYNQFHRLRFRIRSACLDCY